MPRRTFVRLTNGAILPISDIDGYGLRLKNRDGNYELYTGQALIDYLERRADPSSSCHRSPKMDIDQAYLKCRIKLQNDNNQMQYSGFEMLVLSAGLMAILLIAVKMLRSGVTTVQKTLRYSSSGKTSARSLVMPSDSTARQRSGVDLKASYV